MKENHLKDKLTQDIPSDIGISHKRSSSMVSFLFFILALSYLGACIWFLYFVDIGMPAAYIAGAAIGIAIEILLLHALILACEKALEAEAIAAYALNKLNNVPSEYLGCITSADFEQQKLKEQQKLEEQQRLEQQRLEQQRLEQQGLEQQGLEQLKLKEQQKLDQQKLEELKLEELKIKSIRHLLDDFDEGFDMVYRCDNCKWWRPQKYITLKEIDFVCPSCNSALTSSMDLPKNSL